MRYELHCNGQILHSNDLGYLIELSRTIPEKAVIYKFVQSKFPPYTSTPDPTKPKAKRFVLGTREILSYKDAVHCFELEQKGKTRTEIARQMYCSVDKVRITMRHYDFTMSQDEYENTQPYEKINLLIK